MRKNTFVRITELMMRALLLIIVGAYIYLKSTSAATAADMAPGKTPAVLKDFGRNESPLQQDSLSADEVLFLGRIKAGPVVLGQPSQAPEMFYRRFKQPAIYD